MRGRMPFPDPFAPLAVILVAGGVVVTEAINGWIWAVEWIFR